MTTKNTITPYASIESIGEAIGPLIEKHIDLTFREVLRGPNVAADNRFVRFITGEPHPFANLAVMADAVDPSATAAAIEPLLHCGAPAAVLYVNPVTSAVEHHLKSVKFESDEALPAMAVDIEQLLPTSLPKGYRFVRVGNGAEGDAWADAFAIGYEIPRRAAELFSPNAIGAMPADDSALQFFAVVKDGKQVCTSMIHLNDGVAGIYCVATLPEERGMGLGAHATAEPLRIVQHLGYRVGVLQSSSMGHRVYKRLGFADFGELPLYIRQHG